MAKPLRSHVFLTPAVVALALSWLAPGARASLGFEEGRAQSPDGGLLYLEHHLVRRAQGRPLERLVLYRCADGTAFARKRVDYRESVLAPAFALEDARSDYREGLRRPGGPHELFVREGAGETERSARVEAADLVADAGFDEFLRTHWDRLMAGDAVPLAFAVPSRLESMDFTVRRLRGGAQVAGEDAVVFRLALGGWRGWLAPHIDVAYGRESRRLLRFEGLSNLRSDDGRRQLAARIDFPRPARAADEAQWQAFAREPLSACRVRG